MKKLFDLQIKKAKAGDKPYTLADGNGLCVLVKPKGKYWRYNYRFEDKQKTLALGVYPTISLSHARLAHQDARDQLALGIDPSELRRKQKIKKNSKIKQDVRNISINGQVLERFTKAKDKKSLKIGFTLTYVQFLTLLLTAWEKCNEER